MKGTPKVYKTSIVASGNQLEPVRTAKLTATSFQVEAFHIMTFLCVISFMFAGLWRAASKKVDKKVARGSGVPASALQS